MIGYETYTNLRKDERVLKTFVSKNMWITIWGSIAGRQNKYRPIQGIWLTNQRVLTTVKSGFLLPGFLVDLDYNKLESTSTDVPGSLRLGLLLTCACWFMGVLLFSSRTLDVIKIAQGRIIEPFYLFFYVLPLAAFIYLFLSTAKFSSQTFNLKRMRVFFKQSINIQGYNGDHLDYIGNPTVILELYEEINKLKNDYRNRENPISLLQV